MIPDKHLEDLCKEISNIAFQIVSLEDKRLRGLVASVYATFDVFWYFYRMDITRTEEGYLDIRKEIQPYIEQIQYEIRG